MNLEETLEKKRALCAEIERAKHTLQRVPPIDRIQQERWDAQTRINNMKVRHGADMTTWPGLVRGDYNTFKEAVERADTALKDLKEKKAKIEEQVDSLEEQLAELDQKITVKDILPIQDTVADLLNKIASIESLIAEEEGRFTAGGQGVIGRLGKLTKEKEDLLAAIACGESTDQKRLGELSLEIASEKEKRDKFDNDLSASLDKRAGLKRRLGQLQDEIAIAKLNHLDGLGLFLDQEAEKAGREYAKAASVLAETFAKIIALSRLLEKCGSSKEVFGSHTRRFQIPSFLLEACMSQDLPETPGVLFRFNEGDIQRKMDDEIERLGLLGIKVMG